MMILHLFPEILDSYQGTVASNLLEETCLGSVLEFYIFMNDDLNK